MIAAGLCWHAGVSFYNWQTNPYAIGVEAEATGTDPWPAVQYDSYVRGVRALREHYDVPLSHVVGHKESAKPLGRKTDPNFNMDTFRANVARDNDSEDDDVSYKDALQANIDYGRMLWAAPTGTGTALIKSVRAIGAAVAALSAQVKAEDTADDAEFRAAMAQIKAADADLQAAVDALAAEQGVTDADK